MSTFQPLPASAATPIAKYSITPPNGLAVEIGQAFHRIRLVNFWQIAPGSRVLEIGCGQGNATAVLAEAVGPAGHVDAVDPGSPEYGAPFTLRQAQAHLSASAIGERISWHNAEPVDFLKDNADKSWDVVVFSHCIWYFASPELLASMLKSMKGRVTQLLVAEYALKATEPGAQSHVVAAKARSKLEAYNKDSKANIRSMLNPSEIQSLAAGAGWALAAEDIVVPEEDLADGSWEVGTVKSPDFLTEIDTHVDDEKVKESLRSARDEVLSLIDANGGKKARTMDVWVARFTSN